MGFTAVELMPIQEFNELEYYQLIPGSQDTYRFNFWCECASAPFRNVPPAPHVCAANKQKHPSRPVHGP